MQRHDVLLFSAFADADPATVPEWVHLVPSGTFFGVDGRGPYTLSDPAALIAASLPAASAKLPIDENHAIDRAAPKGEPSPARGWVSELQARTDGVWGRVEWTGAGRALMADKAYQGISPALAIDPATRRVTRIARASLVNTPNLAQLTTLHSRSSQHMDFIAQMRAALGLPADATEEAVLAAASAQKAQVETHLTQAALISQAAGLAADAPPAALILHLQAQATSGTVAEKELRQTVISLQSQLTSLQDGAKRAAAEQAVDDAIRAGKAGVKPLRDHYITRHMADPSAVLTEFAALPAINAGGARDPAGRESGARDPNSGLTPADREVCELMGIDAVAFAAAAKLTEEAL